MEKKIDGNRARQGRSGWPVLVVLICALILVAIGWWAVEIYGESIEPENPIGETPTEQVPANPS
ncbi:hypothetical protein [Aquamicrobium zhengzhouense]|uniref:Uncharacterized protein n=1 Tax=Aquamicrobium zhengzhouense TaxID=2781738 RepID=A0ABS0SG54_9HYPH|nr:hypothetical protein [Aquamicrobium zhengzhouense]MBI1621413.1 hypothetical protein [Aquamicrobium zhengzhouense]